MFFSPNHEVPKYCSNSCIQMHSIAHMRYVEYFCDILCCIACVFFISISICLSSTAAYLREHPQSSRSKLPLPKHSIIICNYQHYCYHYNFTPNLCIYLGLGLAENVRVNFLFDKMDGALKIKTKMAALLGLAIFFLLLVYFFFVWLLHLSTLDQSVGPVQFLAPLNWN